MSRHVDKEESLKLIKNEKFIDFCEWFDADYGYEINFTTFGDKIIEMATGINETEKGHRSFSITLYLVLLHIDYSSGNYLNLIVS